MVEKPNFPAGQPPERATESSQATKRPRPRLLRLFGFGFIGIVVCIAAFVGIALATGVFAGTPGHQDSDPAWSPDGARIAFTSNRAGNKDIYVMNPDGSNVKQLTSDPFALLYWARNAVDKQPSWSPDSKHIAFSSGRDNIYWTRVTDSIFVMNTDGSGVTRLSEVYSDAGSAVWSPDGRRIAFESNSDGPWDIVAMDALGSTPAFLTHNEGNSYLPSWSPDGNKIAFVSDRTGTEQIYVMNADGSNVVQLTNTIEHHYNPVWSPDGNRIVYIVQPGSGHSQIYVMNADGSQPTQITHARADSQSPAWSPDGKRLAFSSNRGGDSDVWRIYVMNVDGSNVVQLTGTPIGGE